MAVKYPQYIDVNFLFIGAVFDGLCGSFMLGLALAFSYSADCTSSKHRAMAFGAFQGCLFLGVAIGPALGGLLVEATGNILSIFYVTLVAHFIFIVYILTILPESLSKRRMLEARKKHTAKLLNDGEGKHWSSPKHLFQPLGILFPTGPGTTTRLRLNLILLAIIDCTIFGVGAGGMTVIIMYAERQFHWRNFEVHIPSIITT